MASTTRRSMLQTQILAALALEPAENVSTLAESLERSRPSVSRSLHRLAEAGYVEKKGRSWQLTDSGQETAKEATKALQASTKEVVEIAGKKFRAVSSIHDNVAGTAPGSTVAAALPGLRLDLANTTLGQMSSLIDQFSIADSLGLGTASSAVAAMAGLDQQAKTTLLASSMAESISPIADMAEIARGVVDPSLSASSVLASLYPDWDELNPLAGAMEAWQAEGIAALAGPLVGAQNTYASIMEVLPTISEDVDYSSIASQARLLSSTVADVLAMPDFDELTANLALRTSLDPDLLALPGNLSVISNSLEGVFQENLDVIRSPGFAVPGSVVTSHLYHSTLPVSHFAQANRILFDDELEADDAAAETWTSEERQLGTVELDPLLEKLDPDFVGKRRGAWLAINGSNPDRLAHAAGSQKNLLLQVLRTLVPDEPEVDQSIRGSKIKARIKEIMGGSETETTHVQFVAEAVFSAYSVFNKYDHTNQKDERALRGHMLAGEAMLYMVLVRLEE